MDERRGDGTGTGGTRKQCNHRRLFQNSGSKMGLGCDCSCGRLERMGRFLLLRKLNYWDSG